MGRIRARRRSNDETGRKKGKLVSIPIKLDPRLADIPASYATECLLALGPELLESVDATTRWLNCDPPLQQEFSSSISTAFPPTHLLALNDYVSNHIILQPTHDIVLASQCINLPIMSDSDRFSPSNPTLRAVPLRIPYPASFEPLHRFFYTHDEMELLRSLLPPSFPTPQTRLMQGLTHIAAHYTLRDILAYVRDTYQLSENVKALGVQDEAVHRIIKTVLFILSSAIKMQSMHAKFKKQ